MSELINNQELRIKTLKEVILHLHRGEAPEAVRGQLKGLIADVDASEIAAMEQQLMAEGLEPEQVRSMCDLHADVLREVMAEPRAPRALRPGHPVDTFQRENRALEEAIARVRTQLPGLAALPDGGTAEAPRLLLLEAVNPLMDVEKHYGRKEHLVFTVLERHGNTGPSKVMWSKDDEVRNLLKGALGALREETLGGAELKYLAGTMLEPALAALESMIYKEEHILFPMALGLFTEEEWGEIWAQSQDYGWCLVAPQVGYTPAPGRAPPKTRCSFPPAGPCSFPAAPLPSNSSWGSSTACRWTSPSWTPRTGSVSSAKGPTGSLPGAGPSSAGRCRTAIRPRAWPSSKRSWPISRRAARAWPNSGSRWAASLFISGISRSGTKRGPTSAPWKSPRTSPACAR